MSNISMVEANLPPGFRFYPKDEELVCDYLMKKVESHSHDPQYLLMIEVDLNKCEPWDIPESACVGGKEWYFYSQRDRKYATGLRTNRATASGYWKATGKDRPVLRKGTLVGMRKTLVFYQGRAPKGQKTDWIMHEFRLDGPFNPSKASSQKEDWVLCRVLKKTKESAKPRSWSYDNGGNSLLPPLMDSFISIDQEYHEQVPCFSVNFSHNQTQVDAINNIPITSIGFGHLDMTTVNTVDPLSYDKKLLKSVLDQVTKIDHDQSIEDLQTESFLSELGLSNMWSF